VPPEPLTEEDVFIAYLPLAHVLELAAETLFIGIGARIGYSSPQTLLDTGVKDAEGKPAGDLRMLRPTLLAAVPLILDRFKNSVLGKVNEAGFVKRILFKIAFYLKRRNTLRKQSSPLLDLLVFNKIKATLGGRVRLLLSGGAPLSPDTQQFVHIVFGAPVLQGFGLTETLAANAVTHPSDVQTGNVGAPLPSCEIKLVDVEEMGYFNDTAKSRRPLPQGEILIRGGCVSPGYFDLPEATSQSFIRPSKEKVDGDEAANFPWFLTGDVGQWRKDGTLEIIDRKKDLVKMKHGEYLALGHLESIFKHSPIVEAICVYADGDHQRPIALIVPDMSSIKQIAAKQNVSTSDINAMLESEAVKRAVIEELNSLAAQHKLEKWERIANVFLTHDEWSANSGLLTEAMKLKRHEIKKKYAKEIEQTYKGVE